MAAKQPPPLMKKHSQTDLVSRLKTRKILGVGGEDDDGEVHRSKISQVLGNEIKFAVREPLGLRVWQLVSAVMFSGVAIMALVFPDQLFDAIFEEESVSSKTPIRLYGGALLSECCTTVLGHASAAQSKGTGGQNSSRGQSPCPAVHVQLESRRSAVSKESAEGYFEKLGYCCFFLAGVQACCRWGKKSCACSESLGEHPMYPSKGSLQRARARALGCGWGSAGAAGELGPAAASRQRRRRSGAKGREARGAGRSGVGRKRGPSCVLQRHRAGRAGSAALPLPALGQRAPLSPQASRSSCGTPCTPPRRPSSAGACWPRPATSPCSSWVSARGPAGTRRRRRRVRRLCAHGDRRWAGQRREQWWSIFPASCLSFLLPHGIASALSCSLKG
uniref:Tumor protein p53-inducible protein 11 n=125 Tax=Neognathae TaxID=8825 RepID=A0A8C3D2N1_CORMO